MLKYFDGNLTIALEKALFESALLEDPLQSTTYMFDLLRFS